MYAQLWQLDAKKKHEREQKEAAEKAKAISETMAVLDWQKNTREVARSKEAENLAAERSMLKDKWVQEEDAEKKMHK